MEELKRAEEEKEKGAKGALAKKQAPPPAKKGGKEPDKPVLDVPKLQVPPIHEFTTVMGNKYLIERSFAEITDKLADV
jgi:hypothetical protein